MELLNRCDFNGHLPVQEFCPPDQVLTDGRHPDVEGAETALRDRLDEGSCSVEGEVFLNPVH